MNKINIEEYDFYKDNYFIDRLGIMMHNSYKRRMKLIRKITNQYLKDFNELTTEELIRKYEIKDKEDEYDKEDYLFYQGRLNI